MTRKELTGIFTCFALLFFAAYAFAAPVPDTGQTLCYDVAGKVITCPSPGQALYGQDANYSINPMTYTKLDAIGNTLPDSASSWVMVKDNVTGLIWENKTNDGTIHDGTNTYTWYDPTDTYPGTSGNGKDSKYFIDALNAANFGGYSDWRMPSIKELSSIVNYNLNSSGINTFYFPYSQFVIKTPTGQYIMSDYWSGTTYSAMTSNAWVMHISLGSSFNSPKSINNYVRAVRGIQLQSAYVDNGDGTVTETSAGLMWEKDTPNTMTWEQALSYSENLILAGYTDWRLPTLKELKTIVDYNKTAPAINTTYFPGTTSSFYWSSTTCSQSTASAWSVPFDIGNNNGKAKDSTSYVRAVRGEQAVSTGCMATLDENLMLYIPILASLMDWWWAPAYSADFVYEYNPTYPALIIFKMTNIAMRTTYRPECEKEESTYSDDFKIHIPGLLLADGITHLSVDMEYSPVFSTNGNTCFVVTKYGVVPN